MFHWFLHETAQGVLRLRQSQLLGSPGIRRQHFSLHHVNDLHQAGSFLCSSLRSSSLSMAATIPSGMHGVGLESGSGDRERASALAFCFPTRCKMVTSSSCTAMPQLARRLLGVQQRLQSGVIRIHVTMVTIQVGPKMLQRPDNT